MKQLEELIGFLQASDSTDFVQAVEDHATRLEGKDLEELLQAASRKDIITVCEGLVHQTSIGVDLFSAQPELDELGNPDTCQEEAGSELLLAVAIVARLIFEETKTAPPEALLEAAVLLHNYAILSANEYPALQDEVAKLCLEWWQAEVPGSDRLITQSMPYLLVTALQTGTAVAVKRCHAMRTALELFDFNDPSIGDIKRLLLRAAFAPPFLRCNEGRRFLAYLFTLQPAFVRELTAIVKNQIPAGRKSVLDAYGEVIYRAWTSATGACLLEVQLTCIQELMEAAILASTPAMASALRRVLTGLHSQKHQPGVDRMLLEMYEPILFRRLNAPNPAVRKNALELFVDAFPLRDPEESNEATDARMNEQFVALSRALKDDVPAVRAAAIAGVCRILGTYWELIPGAVITGYLKVIAAELAFDAASPVVRSAVAEGLATLVDNPMAHPLLQLLLPKLEPMLYDASAKVRCAFADLLLSLRGIRALQWNDVVDIQKLLEVMAGDVPSVSGRIQRLLLPSYFPDVETGPSMVAALLRTSPDAGRAFCLYLAGVHIPPTGGVAAATITSAGPAVAPHCLVKLVQDLTAHLLTVPLASEADVAGAAKGGKKGRAKRKKARGNTEADAEEEQDIPVVETLQSWEAILGGVSAVCCGLGALIASGSAENTVVRGLFTGGELARLLDRGQNPAAHAAVACIGAALPNVTGAADIRSACASWLVGTEGVRPDATELRAAVDCLSSTPAARVSLIRATASAFGADADEVCPFTTGEEAGAQRGARGKRKAGLAELDALQDMSQASALEHLGLMLEMESSRAFVLTSGTLSRLLPWIEAAVGARVTELATAVGSGAEAEGLDNRAEAALGCTVYLRACMHLLLAAQANPAEKPLLTGFKRDAARGQALECVQQGMEWANRLLQALNTEADADSLVKALCPSTQPKPTKRSKVAKNKSAGTTSAAGDPAGAMKEAYAAAQACVAIAGEAARLGVITWDVAAASGATAAARAAQLLLGVVRRCMAAAAQEGVEADIAPMAIAAVSHAARMSRFLSLSSHSLSTAAAAEARDLRSELDAQVAEGSPVVPASVNAEEATSDLCQALLQAVCEDDTGACASGAKTHMAGLLAAKCGDGNAFGSTSYKWLVPLAEHIGASIDYDDLPPSPVAQEAEQDENIPAGSFLPHTGGKSSQKKEIPAVSAELLSEALGFTAVKQFVAAAKLVNANEVLAGQAAAVAADAWRRGEIAEALGGVELAQALGFLGVTVRGKSRAGADSYPAVIQALRGVSEETQGTDEVSTATNVPLKSLLQNKLLALFPPAPRVTFGAVI